MGVTCFTPKEEEENKKNSSKRNSRRNNDNESIDIKDITFKGRNKKKNKSCNPNIITNNTYKNNNQGGKKQEIKNKNHEENNNKNNNNKSSNVVDNTNKNNKQQQNKSDNINSNNDNNKNKSYSNMEQNCDYNLVCCKCKSIPHIKEVDYIKELNDFKIKYTCDCPEKKGYYTESYLINFINEEKIDKRINNFISLENREKIIKTIKENKNESNGLQILEKLFEKKIIVKKKEVIQSITDGSAAPLNDGKKYFINYYKSEIQNSNNDLPFNNNLKGNKNNELNDSVSEEKPRQNSLEENRNEVLD